MDCPRCSGPLTEYTLGEARAVVCERCEYVGVPADLRPPAGVPEESWTVALDRFRDDTE